jgi:hypothetical protein
MAEEPYYLRFLCHQIYFLAQFILIGIRFDVEATNAFLKSLPFLPFLSAPLLIKERYLIIRAFYTIDLVISFILLKRLAS